MSVTSFNAPEDIDREDVEKKWQALTTASGNQGRRIEIVMLKESQDDDEKKLGVKTYEFCFEIAGRETRSETVFQTVHDTSVRWHSSFYITAAASRGAKTAKLQVKYHLFNTIEKLRIAGTETELRLQSYRN